MNPVQSPGYQDSESHSSLLVQDYPILFRSEIYKHVPNSQQTILFSKDIASFFRLLLL
ncbi:Uncharacterized protein dnm_013180 [Desulfonema magnum]|uniref:Uncharacterized protein n=1 Tax=Desulfonema magnum TaxID=45655 RepID=A0A975BHC7_9BACT|nr:Uncharacterized protein dnm_013180 [Desulfonema magnum]